MTSKKPKSLEVPIGLKSTPYFWWFLMNIPPYPSFGRENQTYPSAQGHCALYFLSVNINVSVINNVWINYKIWCKGKWSVLRNKMANA